MGEVAALAVEHGHGHRGVGDDLPQLLALALDGLLQEAPLRDVARDRLQAGEAPVLGEPLHALPDPTVLAPAGHEGELAVGVGDLLLPLVLVEAAGLVPVVGAHHVEERPPEELGLGQGEGLLGRGVHVVEAALGVGAVDDVVGRLDDPAEPGLAVRPLEERLASLGQAAPQPERPDGERHGGGGQDGREGEARRHAVGKLLKGQQ